jgi:predicted nucleotidyltransferase
VGSSVEVAEGRVRYDGRTLAQWAPDVAQRIVDRCGATRIVLFGSVARGDDGPDSDLDLLVVLPVVGRRHDAAVQVLRELRDLPVPVDVTVVDEAGFERGRKLPGLIRVALREGLEIVPSG